MTAARTLLEEAVEGVLLEAPYVNAEGEARVELATLIGSQEMSALTGAIADWLEGLSSEEAVKAEVAQAQVDGHELLPYWSGRTLRALALMLRA